MNGRSGVSLTFLTAQKLLSMLGSVDKQYFYVTYVDFKERKEHNFWSDNDKAKRRFVSFCLLLDKSHRREVF